MDSPAAANWILPSLSIARALSLEPELLFLDQPTAGLDPDRSESFCALIATLKRELGLTVVMVTHDLDTIVSISDQVAVLADQKIVALGAVAEVAAAPHPFILNFSMCWNRSIRYRVSVRRRRCGCAGCRSARCKASNSMTKTRA